MGLWGSIKKGFKKITKGVTKVFKKATSVVKKVAKAVKKVVKSKAFKTVLAAAAVYYGGAAVGAWSAPGVPAGGYFAGGAAAAPAAGGVAGGTTAVGGAAAPVLASQQPSIAPPTSTINATAASSASRGSAWDEFKSFARANPTLTEIGGKALGSIGQSLAAGDEAEQFQHRDYIAEMREAARLQEEQRKQLQSETNVAGVDYGGSGAPLNISLLREAQTQALTTPTAGAVAIDPITGLQIPQGQVPAQPTGLPQPAGLVTQAQQGIA